MEEHALDADSWLVVVTFMIVIVLVIRPVKILLPIPSFSSSSKTSAAHSSTQLHSNNDPSKPEETGSESTEAPLPVAKTHKKFPYSLTLDIATAPVIGVLFLLATRSIGGHTLKDGIVGAPESGVEPYSVMILFFSLVRQSNKNCSVNVMVPNM
jgi:hypothetical protein